MISNQLPVYKKTLELINVILKLCEKFPRFYRFTLGEMLTKDSVSLVELIVKANMTEKSNRKPILEEFIIKFESIKALILICSENKLIGLNTQANLGCLMEDIGKQITAWKNY